MTLKSAFDGIIEKRDSILQKGGIERVESEALSSR